MSEDVKKRWPWLKIALIVSVSLNLLIVGAVAGVAWKFKEFGEASGAPIAFARALPPEAVAAVRQNLRAKRDVYRDMRRLSRQARLDLADAVAQDPMDVEAVRAAMADMRRMSGERRAVMDDVLLQTLQDLPLDQRMELAENLKRKAKRRHHRDDDKR